MIGNSFDEIEDTLLDTHKYTSDEVEQIMPKLERIDSLRRERNAIILAHYYQIPPIQLIADYRGDSLQLAHAAKKITDRDLVVCSTVVFMAEMVKLLSPNKKVVVPSLEAGCSIAEGINGEAVRKIRDRFPDAGIVAYVNTYADTKAEVDAICTSSNAEEIVRKINGNPVILLPDYYFATNIFRNVNDEMNGRDCLAYKGKSGSNLILENVFSKITHNVSTGEILPILDTGTCMVHERFTPEIVDGYRAKEKLDAVLSHPEVNERVATVSDFVGGTGKMIKYIEKNPDKKNFLVITECNLIGPLKEMFPDRFFFTPCFLCDHMKRNTLEDLITSIDKGIHEIKLDARTSGRATASMNKMFELTTAQH